MGFEGLVQVKEDTRMATDNIKKEDEYCDDSYIDDADNYDMTMDELCGFDDWDEIVRDVEDINEMYADPEFVESLDEFYRRLYSGELYEEWEVGEDELYAADDEQYWTEILMPMDEEGGSDDTAGGSGSDQE